MLRFLALLCMVAPVPAPVPPCSPWIIINKLVEWNSFTSDSNAQFPVGQCKYSGPIEALLEGDTDAVFLLNAPEKIPRHNIYELVWFLKTGFTRMKRMMLGLEPFVYDFGILFEGYKHYTPRTRDTQLGHGTKRRPELIDDERLWHRFVTDKFLSLLTEGPDLQQTKYTPVGPLARSRRVGPGARPAVGRGAGRIRRPATGGKTRRIQFPTGSRSLGSINQLGRGTERKQPVSSGRQTRRIQLPSSNSNLGRIQQPRTSRGTGQPSTGRLSPRVTQGGFRPLLPSQSPAY